MDSGRGHAYRLATATPPTRCHDRLSKKKGMPGTSAWNSSCCLASCRAKPPAVAAPGPWRARRRPVCVPPSRGVFFFQRSCGSSCTLLMIADMPRRNVRALNSSLRNPSRLTLPRKKKADVGNILRCFPRRLTLLRTSREIRAALYLVIRPLDCKAAR
jgi:hypothetical protein